MNKMRSVELHSASGVCHIYTGESLSNTFKYLNGRKTVIIADENVQRFYAKEFPEGPVITVLQGESSKSLRTITRIYKELLKAEVDRSWFVLGIGGGITTDIAGFVASTYMRGLPFGFVSTTLLGQVDAAIGGKNGVNLQGYKNIIGTIRQPEFVICDTFMLKTLEKKEFILGWAEIIKYAVIKRKDFYSYLEENIDKGLSLDAKVLNEVVYESVKTKVSIVESDEFETAERKILNFGHTFAHSLEKLYRIPHGEAVSIGMTMASQVSVNVGLLQPSESERLIKLLLRAGLPVRKEIDPGSFTNAMKKDKKRAGTEIQLILLEEAGRAVIKTFLVNDLKSLLYDLR